MRDIILLVFSGLLIPSLMLVFGFYFRKKAPEKINHLFGYRTSMSMKNEDTWRFAHLYMGKVWCLTGTVMFIASLIIILLIFNKGSKCIDTAEILMCTIQTIIIVITLIPTEAALRKNFYEDGIRKE
ncbi:MAG: SdpI family protein [Oscillospiraceae bacterium]|nr:SdpI family protein [Oscillospiraceae bacterium]